MQFARIKSENQKKKTLSPSNRRKWVLFTMIALAIGLGIRLTVLQITNNDFLRAKGEARTVHTVNIPSYRGLITDRRNVPLAVSTPMDSVWINPKLIHLEKFPFDELSNLLDIPSQQISDKIQNNANKGFVYLTRGITPEVSETIAKWNVAGLNTIREFRRYYPKGASAAQVVGYTNIDDQGQAGIEQLYDHELKPQNGQKRVLKDRMGHWVQDIDNIQVPKSGENLTLSIDSRIQTLALRELTEAVTRLKAKSATLVMLDVQTGEILCMLSVPSFNPNNRSEITGTALRNRAVTDQIEPGSTIKPFSMLSALTTDQYEPETIVDTNPGFYFIDDHKVRDIRNYGKLTLSKILVKSSNVGISKITLSLPPEQLINTFEKFGLGAGQLTYFPGETTGMLPPPPTSPFVHATLAFGYGLAVTPLQLANAFATLARGGISIPVSLVKAGDHQHIEQKQVIPESHAKTVLNMLTQVMGQQGTGKRGNIKGYKTAGKTGTIRVVGEDGYDPNRHIGLFAGITPIDNPKLATVVIVEEPTAGMYYGSLVSAPIYSKVVGGALRMLNVPPDNT